MAELHVEPKNSKTTTTPRIAPFLFLLAGLAVLSGYLLSKINIIGRAGIALFYKEYRFFKVWWQGALAVFAIWMFLFWLQGFLQKKLVRSQAALLHIAALVIAVIGLYFTYSDFRNDVSHRVIGERFHLGFYLFWIGWMLISLFYLFRQRHTAPEAGQTFSNPHT
jgi:hypothetical protein